jgi:uncharacterized repeat protein (TIGR03803 family)
MRISAFGCQALFSSVVVATLLAACSGSQLPVGSARNDAIIPGLGSIGAVSRQTAGVAFKSLYSFEGTPDGAEPLTSLIAVSNVLYGTTYKGGRDSDEGTVFKISTQGDESVLHRFGFPDGFRPRGDVIVLDNELYGTTSGGGRSCLTGGTVYKVSVATGKIAVLYDFDCKGGSKPHSGLIAVGDTLFGTTSGGGTGTCDCGTVFALNLSSGKQRVIYSFKGGADGSTPEAGLIDLRGALYGTTTKGGTKDNGTVFAVDPSPGKERVVYRFKGGNDGATPLASLIAVGNRLYGTTVYGGLYPHPCTSGCGTVFAVTLIPRAAARERIVYRFKGRKEDDGEQPWAALIDVKGLLFGTTATGGVRGHVAGLGTIFEVSTSGTERVLHAFEGADGASPRASLVELGESLYGTTAAGGAPCPSPGCGTVFTLKL